MSLLLQGCANVTESKKQSPSDLNTLSKDIIDMVDVSSDEQKLTEDITPIKLSENKRNLYSEQALQRLINVPEKIIKQYQQALDFMKVQKWASAEKLFDEILLEHPQLSSVYVNKALIGIALNDVIRASDCIEKALLVNSINPYAHQLKGRISRLNGQFEQAEKSYLEALKIWPQYLEAQVNLAILLELYRGRLLDARRHYLSYLALQPNDEQVLRWLAGIEIKIKRAGLSLPTQEGDDSLSTNSQIDASGNS